MSELFVSSNMNKCRIDIIAIRDLLEQKGKMDHDAAEAIAVAINKAVCEQDLSQLATKDDVNTVKDDIITVKDDVNTVRGELKDAKAELKADIKDLELRLVKHIYYIQAGTIAFTLAAIGKMLGKW